MWSPNLVDIIPLVFKCFGVIRTSITWQINMDSTTDVNCLVKTVKQNMYFIALFQDPCDVTIPNSQ